MSEKEKQWYYLTEVQLGRLVGQSTYLDATEAWERVRKIKGMGHKSTIYYSEFNGFRVIDEDDPIEFKTGLSISSRAKPFRM